jgi:phenylacetic acid degradation operon negative regulatory protein
MLSESTNEPDASPRSPIADLGAAVCSDGAPSARNLLVTVFGDVVAPFGPETELTVQELSAVLADFGASERLIRTSLTRLVNDDLLAARSSGRRSFYRVAPTAIDLFACADERIYRGQPEPWDGHWTVVVLDGAESTPERRAALRQESPSAGWASWRPTCSRLRSCRPSAAATVRRSGRFRAGAGDTRERRPG